MGCEIFKIAFFYRISGGIGYFVKTVIKEMSLLWLANNGIPENRNLGPYKNWKTETRDPSGTLQRPENQEPGH